MPGNKLCAIGSCELTLCSRFRQSEACPGCRPGRRFARNLGFRPQSERAGTYSHSGNFRPRCRAIRPPLKAGATLRASQPGRPACG
jgi:hypothetical protein